MRQSGIVIFKAYEQNQISELPQSIEEMIALHIGHHILFSFIFYK
jgi:hypothetical protein